LSGQGNFSVCVAGACVFNASIENNGAGCASGTTVVARFFNGDTQLGDVQMGAVGGSLSARMIRPGEVVGLASITPVAPNIVTNGKTYRLLPAWTDVRCQ